MDESRVGTQPRPGGRYTWVTWITGLLSGDHQCVWKAWYKTRYLYERRPDPNAEALSRWKADHAAMVMARAASERDGGADVTVEDQNSFKVRGRLTALAGKPDLVVSHPDVPDVLTIIDCKTGEPRDSDLWQMRCYLAYSPRTSPLAMDGRLVLGELHYRDHILPVTLTATDKTRIVEIIQLVAGEAEPARTPSRSECRWCDIAACPDRVEDEAESLTDEF